MSRLAEFHLYDQPVLEGLVRGFRRARGDHKALAGLIGAAKEPRFPKARAAHLRQVLARYRELGAPDVVVRNCRREAEPRAFLLERIANGDVIAEWEVLDLALRAKRQIPAAFDTIGWLADDATRNAKPTPDLRDGWVHAFSVKTPAVREALYASKALHVDDVPVLGADRLWVHSVSDLPRIRGFFEALLLRPPPPIEDYRDWYPHLHAMEFSMDDTRAVPDPGPLAWQYARELASAARAIASVVRMLRDCERRRFCVQVCSE
jgi:hypothetical protein